MSLITRTFKPSMTVGQVYAKRRGVAGPLLEVGNVLALSIAHEEDVKRQPDRRRGGGGNYAENRRVSSVVMTIEYADWNPVNFARSVFGTSSLVAAGTVTEESHTAYKGGLIRLAHPAPSTVVVKKGVDTISDDNYEVRPEGILIKADAGDITDADTLLIDYAHPEHVNIEAITTSAAELEMAFGGLNEADNGSPLLIDVWRVSSGIAQQLALIQDDFTGLQVTGEILADPTKTGTGISRFYRTQMA